MTTAIFWEVGFGAVGYDVQRVIADVDLYYNHRRVWDWVTGEEALTEGASLRFPIAHDGGQVWIRRMDSREAKLAELAYDIEVTLTEARQGHMPAGVAGGVLAHLRAEVRKYSDC